MPRGSFEIFQGEMAEQHQQHPAADEDRVSERCAEMNKNVLQVSARTESEIFQNRPSTALDPAWLCLVFPAFPNLRAERIIPNGWLSRESAGV